jgi:hypothetical protein
MAKHTRRRGRQQARDLKRDPLGAIVGPSDHDDDDECDECGRSGTHAEWCLADSED